MSKVKIDFTLDDLNAVAPDGIKFELKNWGPNHPKENSIAVVPIEYKNKYPNFPQRLYDAMYSYKVEISD